MIKLRPQHLKPSYWKSIADQLEVYFFDEVLRPIISIIRGHNTQPIKVENASEDFVLKSAIRSGQIQYTGGIITGKFSAAISKALKSLGAKFDKRRSAFILPQTQAPQWLLHEADNYLIRARLAHALIEDELTRAVERIRQSSYFVDAGAMVDKVDAGWRESAKKLMVKPELGEHAKDNLAKSYSHNLDLYIKKWMNQDIIALRRDVQDNANAGFRFDSLIEKIKQRKSVSESKAKFLARQETGLYMSEYRAQRFQEAGVTHYEWSNSHDSRVRPEAGLSAAERLHAGNHRILQGQKFSYVKKAPAQYMSVRQPCNPGEDYNCRCHPADSQLTFSNGIVEGFKRFYRGPMIHVFLASGTKIRATPNHQVFTLSGWKPIGSLNAGERIFNLKRNSDSIPDANINNNPSSIGEIFRSLSDSFGFYRMRGAASQFHGDGTAGNVEIVRTDLELRARIQPQGFKSNKHFPFSMPGPNPFNKTKAVHSIPRIFAKRDFSVFRQIRESQDERFMPSSNGNVGLLEPSLDNGSFNTHSPGDGKLTFAGDIGFNNSRGIHRDSIKHVGSSYPSVGLYSPPAKMLGDIIRTKADDLSNFTDRLASLKKFDSVVKMRVVNFVGHVYNLQTITNWYCIDGIISHNCVDIPLLA